MKENVGIFVKIFIEGKELVPKNLENKSLNLQGLLKKMETRCGIPP